MDSKLNIGILGLEIYFPNQYVAQEDLEVFDKCGKGKYTIGLGQQAMSFVTDREDITSISLTCLKNLMLKYNIKPE
jgi:hydroxymethylglutaryl-CoA synthase